MVGNTRRHNVVPRRRIHVFFLEIIMFLFICKARNRSKYIKKLFYFHGKTSTIPVFYSLWVLSFFFIYKKRNQFSLIILKCNYVIHSYVMYNERHLLKLHYIIVKIVCRYGNLPSNTLYVTVQLLSKIDFHLQGLFKTWP